jgi:hypothetical protein
MEIKINLSTAEHKDLLSYCNLNDLLISSVVKDSFTTGFNIERYGLLNTGGIREKQVEKEVIVEKRVEIPVEVIKEVVRIEYVEVEKPVEKIVEKEVIKEIIKEVPVEKLVEKEVIREVIKEVPVDRVVEKVVEVIKEIPVEKVVIQDVIKEVIVEKIVYVTDQEEMNTKIFQKEQEFEEQRQIFSIKTQELENIFHNEKKELLLKIQQLETREPEVKEIIREVEVIKEIIIEKEGDSSLKPKLEALQSTVQKLKQDNIEKDKKIREYEQTIQDIQKFQEEKKAMFLRGSNLDDKLYK